MAVRSSLAPRKVGAAMSAIGKQHSQKGSSQLGSFGKL
jgi:hypothetical protein